LDNFRVHLSKATEQFTIENHIERVPHSHYSPDLAPSDFWFFRYVKTSLVGQILDEPEQLLEVIAKFLNEIPLPEMVALFSHWEERVRWVLENNGHHHHE
jgi:transposase